MTKKLPPRWAFEGFIREAGSAIIIDDLFRYPNGYKSVVYGAHLYAQLNKQPEDSALSAMRKAIAKAEEASTLLLKLGGRVTPEQFDDASDDAALAA